MKQDRLGLLRKRVAREAALLLYTSQEKEYKQAKKKAAKTIQIRVLPSNYEIAKELDKIAEENEGSKRRELLVRMRTEALQLMAPLIKFNPRLIGSVWRGTANRTSDIDVVVFAQNPRHVLDQLQKTKYEITSSSWQQVTKRGKKESSFHIHLRLPSGDRTEVIVRSPEKRSQLGTCEIYGDALTGLDFQQLQNVLNNWPFQRFVPT